MSSAKKPRRNAKTGPRNLSAAEIKTVRGGYEVLASKYGWQPAIYPPIKVEIPGPKPK